MPANLRAKSGRSTKGNITTSTDDGLDTDSVKDNAGNPVELREAPAPANFQHFAAKPPLVPKGPRRPLTGPFLSKHRRKKKPPSMQKVDAGTESTVTDFQTRQDRLALENAESKLGQNAAEIDIEVKNLSVAKEKTYTSEESPNTQRPNALSSHLPVPTNPTAEKQCSSAHPSRLPIPVKPSADEEEAAARMPPMPSVAEKERLSARPLPLPLPAKPLSVEEETAAQPSPLPVPKNPLAVENLSSKRRTNVPVPSKQIPQSHNAPLPPGDVAFQQAAGRQSQIQIPKNTSSLEDRSPVQPRNPAIQTMSFAKTPSHNAPLPPEAVEFKTPGTSPQNSLHDFTQAGNTSAEDIPRRTGVVTEPFGAGKEYGNSTLHGVFGPRSEDDNAVAIVGEDGLFTENGVLGVNGVMGPKDKTSLLGSVSTSERLHHTLQENKTIECSMPFDTRMLATSQGPHGVRMKTVGQCGNTSCLTEHNKLKNSVARLQNDLLQSKDNLVNANRLVKSTDEEIRTLRLQVTQLNLQLESCRDEEAKLKRKLLSSGSIRGSTPPKKPRSRLTAAEKLNNDRGIMPCTSVTLGSISIVARQELAQEEATNPHGGLIVKLGEIMLTSSVYKAFISETLTGTAESLVSPWEEKQHFGPVIGFYPEHILEMRREEGPNPHSMIYPLPPEPIFGGLGSPSIGMREDDSPLILTSPQLADQDVGVLPRDPRMDMPGAVLVGYQPRTMLATIDAYGGSIHTWHGFHPEWDLKGLRKASSVSGNAPLGLQRMLSRFTRTVMAGDDLTPECVKEGFDRWKADKIKVKASSEGPPAGFQSLEKLGLTEGDEMTANDLQIFCQGISQSILRCPSIGTYLYNAAQNFHSNRRMDFQKGYCGDLGMFEFDSRLGDLRLLTKRSKKARNLRYYTLYGTPAKKDGVTKGNKAARKDGAAENDGDSDSDSSVEKCDGNSELLAQYRELAKDGTGLNFGNVRVLDARKGKVAPANTFTSWRGSGTGQSNGWRIHTNETCTAFNTDPKSPNFGFGEPVNNVEDDVLFSEKFWEERQTFPLEKKPRDSGPALDLLFRTPEARERMIRYMDRAPELTYVMRNTPDLLEMWDIDVSKITKSDLGAVKMILGDTTLLLVGLADTDMGVGFHGRWCEIGYNIKLSSSQHTCLFKSLFIPFCLNLYQELYTICTKIPSFKDIELRIPFDNNAAMSWRQAREDAGLSSNLICAEDQDENDPELQATRHDFVENVEQLMDPEMHGFSWHVEEGKKYTHSYWSESDNRNYLVLTTEAFKTQICPTLGEVRDAHIAYHDPKEKFTGWFKPIAELPRYKNDPAVNILRDGPVPNPRVKSPAKKSRKRRRTSTETGTPPTKKRLFTSGVQDETGDPSPGESARNDEPREIRKDVAEERGATPRHSPRRIGAKTTIPSEGGDEHTDSRAPRLRRSPRKGAADNDQKEKGDDAEVPIARTVRQSPRRKGSGTSKCNSNLKSKTKKKPKSMFQGEDDKMYDHKNEEDGESEDKESDEELMKGVNSRAAAATKSKEAGPEASKATRRVSKRNRIPTSK